MVSRTEALASGDPAQIYEAFFVPSLFAPWSERVLDLASPRSGAALLDVACGTGILARQARVRLGEQSDVAGVDPDERMLGVARSSAPEIAWEKGTAQALPFSDERFDHCVSQFGMMFFPDPSAALAEMARVTRPGGNVAVAVWDSVEGCPAFGELADLLEELYDEEVANGLRSPFAMGDPERLHAFTDGTRLANVTVHTLLDDAVFDDMETWMVAEAHGWLALQRPFTDEDFSLLLERAHEAFGHYVEPDGRVRLPMKAHVLTGTVTA